MENALKKDAIGGSADEILPLENGDRLSRFEFERRYHRMDHVKNTVLESRCFPGLRLDIKALLAGDMQKVLLALQEGMAAALHGAFVKSLEKKYRHPD